MLLTNRRYQFLSIALAGMEVACYLPLAWLAFLYWERNRSEIVSALVAGISPIAAVAICLLLWLAYLLLMDLINGQSLESPQREAYLLGAIVLSSLVLVRVFVYPSVPFFDFRWLSKTISAIFNFTDGWRAELALILANLFLWVRVVLSLGRSLTFMSVGLSFRLSLLIAIIGNALLASMIGLTVPLQFFTALLIFGLFAVAIARIDEKSIVGEHSSGAVLSWNRLGLLAISVAVAIGVGLLLARFYTPQTISAFLGWFSPLWTLLGKAMAGVLAAILWLIAPFLQWIIDALRSLTENVEMLQPAQEQSVGEGEPLPMNEMFDVGQFLHEWTFVRYGLVLLIIGAIGAFLWLFFIHPYLRQLSDEEEELEQESANIGLGGLRSGLDRLRNLAKLVGRFGLSLELLDAISIENMYANLGRIARQRGYPRQPNQPPDEYIHALRNAFPGRADGLQRLTSAYMRVHYGDQSMTRAELEELRTLYQDVRTAEPDEVIQKV